MWGETRRAQGGHPGLCSAQQRLERNPTRWGEKGPWKVQGDVGCKDLEGKMEQRLRWELDTGTSDHREGE